MRQIDAHFPAARVDELDAIENAVLRISYLLINTQPPQNRPTRGIDAVAANFFARELFAFEENRAQSVSRTKCRAGRARRAAADDCDVKEFHVSFSVGETPPAGKRPRLGRWCAGRRNADKTETGLEPESA